MYVYTGAPDLIPLPGVPTRDLSDEEFAAVAAEYGSQFPEAPLTVLVDAGWFRFKSGNTASNESEGI